MPHFGAFEKPPKTYRYDSSLDPALSWDESREDAPQMDAMRMPAHSPAHAAPMASARMLYREDERTGDRTGRLAALESAAAEGRSALYELERATRDSDSVVALRATELLRQLREQRG